jgi:ATP-binding cassette subfamily B protein
MLGLVRPYWRGAVLALVMLGTLVLMDLAIPRLVQRIIDQGIQQHDRGVVIRTSLLMLGISAVSTLIAIANNVLSVRVGEGVARDLRETLFLRIQRYSPGNLDRQKTGQLLVRLTSDVSAVKALTQISLRIGTRAPLLMIGSLVLMISTSSHLALLMVPILVVTTILIFFFVIRMEPMFQRVQKRLDAVNNVLQENIAGARLIKATVRRQHEDARFDVVNEEMTLQSIKLMQLMSSMTPALTMCINMGVVVVIWLGGLQSIRGGLSLGQLVAFTNYLMTTMTPLVMMTMLSNTWAAGLASMRRMDEILDATPDVQDAVDATSLSANATTDVAFQDVSFSYGRTHTDPGDDAVLRNVSLAGAPGKTIAILGSTGAGKSTLVNLIPRFYDVSQGRVTVAGHDVRALTQDSLLSQVGLVSQESLLFSGTVRDNIRYGRPDASDLEVQGAAQAAQAHEFIAKLPLGYESPVAPRGANFSGGQKQRIAIARALLLNPRILILDDSTSAVDVETETRIQAALAVHGEDRVTFVVAQRISTVLNADTIVVLDQGRIVAQGTHAELLQSSAEYQEIYDSQLGGGTT